MLNEARAITAENQVNPSTAIDRASVFLANPSIDSDIS